MLREALVSGWWLTLNMLETQYVTLKSPRATFALFQEHVFQVDLGRGQREAPQVIVGTLAAQH